MEAAQEALTFTKRAKAQGISDHDMQILEELEEMLETQQKELLSYKDQISELTNDLELERVTNVQKTEAQNKIFDALKQIEEEKAAILVKFEDFKLKMAQVEEENGSLHMVAQENNSVIEEKVQLSSMLAQLQTENESL